MREIKIVDTTLRDGQQSTWACRMRAAAMLPAIADMDAAGYDAIEFSVPTAQFSRAVKDLHEDPWDWLRLGSGKVTRTELRLHGTGSSPFVEVPRCVQMLLLDKMVELGITTTRTSDPWNNMDRLGATVSTLRSRGIETVVNVIYSVSSVHTIEYFAGKVQEAAGLSPLRICFKDVGGLLTPERADELFPVVMANAGGLEVEFHGHCSNGLGPYVALKAAEHGITVIHTALPPLANGNSLPSVFTVVENLRARGFSVGVDLTKLNPVREHFARVAHQEGFPPSPVAEFSEQIYSHQVPGGMLSNLAFQLEQLGMRDRLAETLQEAGRVRADFGNPIMVTPLAQFVGSQAALNVVTGKRYSTVTDEVIRYALGEWGSEAVEVMDPQIRQLILDRPRVREFDRPSAPEPSIAEVRARFGEGTSDDEIISRVLSGVGAGELRFGPSPNPDLGYEAYNGDRNVVGAVRKALQEANCTTSVRYEAPDLDFEVRMQR